MNKMTNNISDIVITEEIIRYRTRVPDFLPSGKPTGRGVASKWKEVPASNLIPEGTELHKRANICNLENFVAFRGRNEKDQGAIYTFGTPPGSDKIKYVATLS